MNTPALENDARRRSDQPPARCGWQAHVLTGLRRTARFRKGFRSGEGDALAVVRPGTLLEQCEVLQACVAADKIVILQAASTGLTEGSTPNGAYDRGLVVISTCRD